MNRCTFGRQVFPEGDHAALTNTSVFAIIPRESLMSVRCLDAGKMENAAIASAAAAR